jgi:hypothetical protein
LRYELCSIGIDNGANEELEVSDREQIEERLQQEHDRIKLKHDALNRVEKKKNQLKGKKPSTAVGGTRTKFK